MPLRSNMMFSLLMDFLPCFRKQKLYMLENSAHTHGKAAAGMDLLREWITFLESWSASTLGNSNRLTPVWLYITHYIWSVMARRLRLRRVVHPLEGWRFDPQLLQSTCRSGPGQATEPQIAPELVSVCGWSDDDEQVDTLHRSLCHQCMIVWMGWMACSVKLLEWSED